MKNIVKIIAFLMCAFMVSMSFAACFGDGDTCKDGHNYVDGVCSVCGKKQGSAQNSIENPWWTTTGSLEKDGDGNVIFDEVEINLTSVVAGEDLAALETIIAEFNAIYTGKIYVSLTSISQAGFESTVTNQILQNTNAPDLIMSHQKGHAAFADSKIIQPFDEALEESGIEINMNDYSTSLSQYASLGYEGYTFGVPVDAQSQVVYYNKQLLAKYGGELPTTREELLELCRRFKNGEGSTPISWSTSLSFFADYTFLTAVVQNGGHFYDDEFRADWYSDETNRKAFTNAIASIKELSDLGYASIGKSEAAALNDFLSNKALFLVYMPWNLNSLITSYGQQNGGLSKEAVMQDRIGATSLANWFAMDGNGENGDKIFGDSHFFAMTTTVTDITKKAAICEFVKWFTQTGSVGADWAEAGHISASTYIINSDEYQSNRIVNDYVAAYYPDINLFETVGLTPYYSDTFTALSSFFAEGINLPASQLEGLLQSKEEEVNAIIDFFK